MKVFSIVIPVYFNEFNLPDIIPRLLELTHMLQDYILELIFVDDGSGDRSIDILLMFQSQHPETIKVVKLTRNFGTMAAIQAGFAIANGNCVGMIAADLQDPPELFLEMIRHWEQGNKAVFAVRQGREESLPNKIFSNGYYALLRKFAIRNYPLSGFDFFLVDRQIIEEIKRINEKNTNLMTLIFWLGFKPILIPYIRRKREKGKSRWTLSKKIKLFIDTFVAFSYFPIRILSALGLLVALTSFSYGAYIFIYWLFFGFKVEGWVSTMLILIFTAGIQMTMLGILGEYLWRTLDETRGRPQFVIDEVFDASKNRKERP